MTRPVPPGLAPILERLELDQPLIVTLGRLAALVREAGIKTPAALVAHRLHRRGWLLQTGIRGAWEFAPAAHAGPVGRGGPLLAVQAALVLHPGLPAALALATAAWAHGFADRAPTQADVALPPGTSVPAGLRRNARVLPFEARLASVERKGVPTHRVETLLVHLAARPLHVRSWGGVAEWIPDAAAEAGATGIMRELEDRPVAVRARLAYLLQGVWPELAVRLGRGITSKAWFGPRRRLRRHSQRWHVADSLLPFDPAQLPPRRAP